MPSRVLRLLPLLFLLVPTGLAAQLPVPIALEGRIGYAVPQGEFADAEGGFSAGGGPSVAIGARVEALRGIALFAGYQQSWFACETCEIVGLDDSAVLRGYEAGLQLSLPLTGFGASPWLRGGIAQQTLEFSGFGESARSEAALGFSGALGLAIPLADGRVELSPALRYLSYPAEYDFSVLPDRDLDVSALSFDIGLAFRL